MENQPPTTKGGDRGERRFRPYSKPGPSKGKPKHQGKGPKSPAPSYRDRNPKAGSIPGASKEASIWNRLTPSTAMPPPPPLSSSTPSHPQISNLPFSSPISPPGPMPNESHMPPPYPFYPFPTYPFPAYPMGQFFPPAPQSTPNSRDPALIREIVEEVVSQVTLHTSTIIECTKDSYNVQPDHMDSTPPPRPP